MNTLAAAVTSGSYLRGDGTNVLMSAIQAADVPTLNQDTTGTAANVTGTVAVANGGTGQTTRQAAIDALAGAVTSGQYLRGDGTNVLMSGIQAADVPTLNQDTTGTAGNVTGTVAVANGGTGATSLTANNVILGNGTSAVQEVAPGVTGNVLTSNGTTWVSSPSTGGGVTAVSVATANGFAGTSSGGATPSLTLRTTISGIMRGNGTSVSAAIPNTDYIAPSGLGSLSSKTIITGIFANGYTEEVVDITGPSTPALSPLDGSIQTWTLTGNSTPTAGTWASGQSLTLMVDDGTASAITWTSLAVTWKTDGGNPPELNTTGFTAIQLWKVDTVIYGARVGDA
jgi:hypothetical protein